MKITGEEKTDTLNERAAVSSPTGEQPPPRNRLLRLVSRRENRSYLIVAALFAALALVIILLSTGRKEEGEEGAEAATVSVRVAVAERGEIAAEVTALGTISPREVATVSPKINAQIKQMALLKNKPVRAGEPVATLESRDLQAQRQEAAAALEEAEANARLLSGGTIPETNAQDEKALRDARANVAIARATYDRRLALYEKGGISKKDLEASQLALTTAENDLRLAETSAKLHQATTNPNNRA
ncbi:MAG TPA: biotin/lipoyl-binding protein, partial [Blastocatellia bacterium]|nr:biotin/lipoyl-binding protein [Blastocatellia bacterium]